MLAVRAQPGGNFLLGGRCLREGGLQGEMSRGEKASANRQKSDPEGIMQTIKGEKLGERGMIMKLLAQKKRSI